MQINNLGGVPAFNLHMPMNMARTMKSIPEPKFGDSEVNGIIFLTKTEATRSDEEIKNDVIAMAKNHAQNINKKKPGYMTAPQKQEYDKLFQEYMSPYSPDRKAIFAKGADAAQTEIKSRISKPIIDTSLFELWFFGKKNSVKTSFYYDYDNKNFDIGSMIFYENGEEVGSYGPHGWGWAPTEAEIARRVELAGIYAAAFEAERSSSSNAAPTGFDFAAHNVSNQQNQAAQNTPAQQAISRYEQMQHAEHKK